jgi:hypothetical protein
MTPFVTVTVISTEGQRWEPDFINLRARLGC